MRRHLSFANAASALALLLALTTSGAYAASQLAPKSVGERQLQTRSRHPRQAQKERRHRPQDQGPGGEGGQDRRWGGLLHEARRQRAITTPKLANDSVITEKLGPEAVTGEKVNEGTLGQVPSADKANTASFADSANPAAFAKVDKAGNLDAEQLQGHLRGQRDRSRGLLRHRLLHPQGGPGHSPVQRDRHHRRLCPDRWGCFLPLAPDRGADLERRGQSGSAVLLGGLQVGVRLEGQSPILARRRSSRPGLSFPDAWRHAVREIEAAVMTRVYSVSDTKRPRPDLRRGARSRRHRRCGLRPDRDRAGRGALRAATADPARPGAPCRPCRRSPRHRSCAVTSPGMRCSAIS